MLFAAARFRKIRIVVLYIRVGSPMVKLARKGGTAGGCARRLFFDDTFMLVAIVVMFGHLVEMIPEPGSLYCR